MTDFSGTGSAVPDSGPRTTGLPSSESPPPPGSGLSVRRAPPRGEPHLQTHVDVADIHRNAVRIQAREGQGCPHVRRSPRRPCPTAEPR